MKLIGRIGNLRQLAGRLVPLPSAIVLAYHRIIDVESDPQLLCVSPQNFADQLEVLRQRFNVLRLAELRQRMPLNRWHRRTVVITFDDGYADNLHFAHPCLESANLPATVFVTAGKVGNVQEFWWDELEALLLTGTILPCELNLQVDGRSFSWFFEEGASSAPTNRSWHVLMEEAPTSLQALYLALTRWIRGLPPQERYAVMQDVRAWAGGEKAGRPAHRSLNAVELRELAQSGLVEVGSHTVSHPVLSALPLDQQYSEIAESKRLLEECLGKTVTSFAYPFGGRQDYTKATGKLVKSAGYASACSNFEGHVTMLTDPYQIPRYIVRNWDADEFNRRLESWLAL